MSSKRRNKKESNNVVTDTTEYQKGHSDGLPYVEPILSTRRIVTRLVFVISMVIMARLFFGQPSELMVLAPVDEHVDRKFIEVACSKDYREELLTFKGCNPSRCGRAVIDGVVTKQEAAQLLSIAKRGLTLGGSNGGASIIDLHSGALSKGDKFINIYSLLDDRRDLTTTDDLEVFKRVRVKMQNAIANEFGISPDVLYLTKPNFFSRITSKPARTAHDEYWHIHNDKEQYDAFHYTSLLYLTDYKKDFTGGRFVFVDKTGNSTIEPKFGRMSFFTSGSENLHHVEPVSSGIRFAVTVAFTCDRSKGIPDLS